MRERETERERRKDWKRTNKKRQKEIVLLGIIEILNYRPK